MKLLFISIAISSMAFTFKVKKDDKPAYKIFNSEGKEVSYDDMVKELSKKEVNDFLSMLSNNNQRLIKLLTDLLESSNNGYYDK